MNTKVLAVTIILAAVTVALNPVFTKIAIPAPYAPFLFYQIWEIPIVTAFVLINHKSAITIAVLNAIVLMAIFPGALILGPFYNLLAVLSMLLGVYMAHKLATRMFTKGKNQEITLQQETKLATAATASGILFRVGLMTIVNYVALRFGPPVGYGMNEMEILAAIPLIAIFNATLALYTIPIGYLLAKAIRKNLKISKIE
ncbi:MAG: hypothetical protein NWF00_00140 [Candidatus Bathyarchaeota archaeon]|nr:hypothetical protein [Candidatus Bathyarchaeota archaeon]